MANAKVVLSLDNDPFLKGMRKSLAVAMAAGRQFAKAPFKTTAIVATLGSVRALRGLAGGMGRVVAQSARMASTVARIGIPLLTAGLIAGTVHAYNFGSEMQDMADRTGVSVEKLVVLTQAMKDNGIESAALLSATKKINTTLVEAAKGSGTAAAQFSQVGLSVRELLDMEPGERFMAIGKAIGGLGHDATRSAAAVSLLGKSGQQFLSLFADPEAMKTAAESVGSQAQIFGRNAALFDRISDRLGRIQVKIRGLLAGVAERIGPMMDKLTAIFDKKDFADWGRKIGDAINNAAAWFVTFWNEPGKTMNYFWELAKAGALDLGNTLLNVAVQFGEALARELSAAVRSKAAGFVGAMLGDDAADALRKGDVKPPEMFGRSNVIETIEEQQAREQKMRDGLAGKQTREFKDFLGAAEARANAVAARPNLERARGMLGANKTPVTLSDTTTPWRLRGFHDLGRNPAMGMMRFHSALQGASMAGYLNQRGNRLSAGLNGIGSLSNMHQGAYGQTPLISHREMERYRSIAVSRGVMSIDGMPTRRPGEVHAGDRARRRAFEKDEERKRVKGLTEKEALNEIVKTSKATADATKVIAEEMTT